MSASSTPRKRPYGHGSVAVQGRAFVASHKDLDTGRTIRRSFQTDDEAQVYLDEWYARKRRLRLDGARGLPAAPVREPTRVELSSYSFAELIDLWREFKTGSVRETTWRNYGPALTSLKHYLGSTAANEIGERDFVRYREARLKGLDWVARSRVAPLSPRTINAHLDRANDVFTWAGRHEPPLVSNNPLTNLVRRGAKLKTSAFTPAVIDGAAIEKLIASAPEAYRLEFLLMGHLALRWGEALGIGVRDIHDGRVHVHQQVIENRELRMRGPGAAGSAPSEGVRSRMEVSTYGGKTPWARRELIASEAILRAATLAAADLSANPHGLLRRTRTGAPYRENNWLRSIWKPTLQAAGLDDFGITPHSLRHSRLSLMASSKRVAIGDLSKFAGHSNVAFTLSRYGGHFSTSSISPDLYLATTGPDENPPRY